MIKSAPAILAALMLAACSTTSMQGVASDASMVEGIAPQDRKAMADATADLVRTHATPGNNALGVQQASDAEFASELTESLRRAGYSVEAGDRLIYQIGPFGSDILMRVSIDNSDATRLYARTKDGHLEPKGPVTVRRMGSAPE